VAGGDIGAFGVRCACEQKEVVPGAFFLHAPSPSPFGASTTLRLDVPTDAGRVFIAVYNARGQLVRTLLDDTPTPGTREYVWRGDDASGNALGAGIYFARCESNAGAMTRKLVLLR
jgi:flagellar hook assembly protein FlgD